MSARSLGLAVTVLALAWPAAAQDDPDRQTDDVPARVLLDSERPIVVTVTRGGAPAPDVGLTLSWSAPRRGALSASSLRTDAAGQARIQGRNGLYRFSVAPGSGWFGAVEGRLDFGDDSLQLTLALEAARALRCQLLREDTREPLGGARVHVFGGGTSRTVTTDADGEVEVGSLADEEYALTVFPPGKRSVRIELRPADEVQVVAVPLRDLPETVEVHASVALLGAGGVRLPAPRGLVLSVGGAALDVAAVSSSVGRWEVGSRPSITVAEGAADYAVVGVEGLPIAAGRPVEVLVVEKLPVRVRVVAGGQPVDGAEVTLDGATLTPGEPGHYRTSKKLAPGRRVWLEVSREGYASWRGAVEASALMEVALQALFSVEGQVAFQGGPAPDTLLVLSGPEGVVGEATTRQDGTFTLTEVPRGEYSLYAIPLPDERREGPRPGWSRASVAVTGEGARATLELAPTVTVTGVLTSPTGSPGRRALLFSPRGEGLGLRHAGGAEVGADGSFEISLPPGVYDVVLVTDSERRVRPLPTPVEVLESARLELEEPARGE